MFLGTQEPLQKIKIIGGRETQYAASCIFNAGNGNLFNRISVIELRYECGVSICLKYSQMLKVFWMPFQTSPIHELLVELFTRWPQVWTRSGFEKASVRLEG